MKKKQSLTIVILLAVGLIAVGGFVAWKKLAAPKPATTADTAPKAKRKITEPVNIIAVEDRPYLQILPTSDGRNVILKILEVKKAATDVDYELEYQSGTLLQGAFGNILATKIPAEKKILLGSCSAGGACTYHENVQGGTLLTRFTSSENYALKSEWKYIDNKAKEKEFSSTDAKFQISSDDLANNRYLIIFNTAGHPKGLKGTLASEIYSLATDGVLKGKAKVTIRAKEEGTLTLVGYNGTKWVEFRSTTVDKMISADVDLMELYAVVKK